jgi:murein L,D-transpeptidase YafK
MTVAFALGLSIGHADNASNSKPDPIPVTPTKDTLPEALVQLGLGKYFSDHAFVMDKANRTLTVWKQVGDRISLVTAVAADFGRNSGDKTNSGDHRTPEGIYFFQELKEGSELNFDEYGVRAFTLDYPNFYDSQEKKSGSGIWLHAIPDSKSLLRGSRGCVVVRNDVIKALSSYIVLKRTPILIQDNVKYVSTTVAAQIRQRWRTWLEVWRQSWESKNLDQYISHYADTFRSMSMNRDQWRQFKKNLADKYSFIKIAVAEPIVIHHNHKLVVRFLQDYQSDKNADFGEKTLYLRREGENEFKIIGEEWAPTARESYLATHSEEDDKPAKDKAAN